jgi:ABC-2 type transport system permease protein
VRMIDLLLKDMKQLVRDWKAAAFLVVMPIVFTLFFGFIFAGTTAEEDPRLQVGFLDQDGGSVLSTHLLGLLNASDAIRPIELEDEDVDDVEKSVGDEELAAAVIIPAGYSERTLRLASGQAQAGAETRLTVIVDGTTVAGSTAQSGIQVAVTRLQGAVQTAQLSADALVAQGGTTDKAFLLRALDRAIQAWTEPPLTITVTQSGAVTEDEENTTVMSNAYAQSSPGMIVQFSIAGLIGAANILVLERKSKSLQRLLTTAISRVEIILGHFLAMFVMVFLQLVLLMGFGQVALGLDYLREPLAALLLMVTMSLWTAGLGLLIGVLAKTEDQVHIFALIPMFVLSGMGGAWMPLEFTGETFQTMGHLLPTAWAMDGFQNILVRGLGLESVLLSAGIMLAYAVVFFGLAVWRFRFE